MPNRIISDITYTSQKLRAVDPLSYRAEYAWLVPIVGDRGVFEYDARRIWAFAYATNRPDWTAEMVEQLLEELVRVKLIFRWTDEDGKCWGYWVGSEKPGLLPKPSERHSKFPIPDTAALQRFLGGQDAAQGLTGIGLGIGIGSGNNDDNYSQHSTDESESKASGPEMLSLLSKLETSLTLTGSISDLLPLVKLYSADYLLEIISWTVENTYWCGRLRGKTVKDFVRACLKENAILDQYKAWFKERSGGQGEEEIEAEAAREFIIQED